MHQLEDMIHRRVSLDGRLPENSFPCAPRGVFRGYGGGNVSQHGSAIELSVISEHR